MAELGMKPAAAESRRFIGGMNLARPLGRLSRTNATVPVAVMTVHPDRVQIGPLWLLRRVLPRVDVPRPQVEAVHRSTGLLTPGVALRAAGEIHYFWTWRGRYIVAELQTLGYPTQPPRRAPLLRLLGFSRKPLT